MYEEPKLIIIAQILQYSPLGFRIRRPEFYFVYEMHQVKMFRWLFTFTLWFEKMPRRRKSATAEGNRGNHAASGDILLVVGWRSQR